MAVRPLIGFNAAQPGNLTNLGDYVRGLDAAGIPAVIMGVGGSWGDIEGCWNNGSTVPHVACVRYMPPGGGQDVPPYGTDINTAVSQWLDWYIPLIGADVKRYPQRVITKHGNELNKNQIVWLCEFYKALHPELLRRMGWSSHRICCFSFASGEPEPEHWEQPAVLEFLRLAGENPDKWVIGLHEYSYTTSAIFSKKDANGNFVPMQPGDPYTLVGRFTKLYEICDRHHIPRPHVLIHEFGWEMARIPAINMAMQHIAQAAALYAQYPTVLGEGTWTLKDYHGIQNQVQPLILPVRDFTLATTFPDPTPPPDPEPPDPPDGDCPGKYRVKFHRRYVLLPESAGPEWATAVAEASYDRDPGDFTVGKSADDAGGGDLEEITVIPVNPQEWQDSIRDFFAQYYPRAEVLEVVAATPAELKEQLVRYIETGSFDPPPTPQPTPGFDSPVGWDGNQAGDKLWPDHYIDANPIGSSYSQGRHTGADLNDNVTAGWDSDALAPTFAIGNGVVTCAQTLGGTWGPVVVNDHGPVGPFPRICSRYGHLKDFTVQVGQPVTRGQQIGRIGNANGQLAYHLHFDIAVGDVLINNPGDWPGSNFDRVVRNYLEPRSFLRLSRPGMVWPEPQQGTANASVNFRTGPGTNFAIYRTLAQGTAVTVLNTLDGFYLLKLADGAYGWCSDDYIDVGEEPDPNPDPPPYQYNGRAVTFRPALHGPADDWAWQLGEVQAVFNATHLPVKFLSNGLNHTFFQPFTKPAFHLVRVMWKAKNVTPEQMWNEVAGDFSRMYSAGARNFELHNEPNLTSEGLGVAWQDGESFGNWLKALIDLIRASYGGNVKLYYPGCSPGVPWTNQLTFTDRAWPIVRPLLDGFCLHAYTGNNSNVETAAQEIANQVIEAQAYLNLQVPLVVSEASVNRGTNYEQKAAVYRRVEELLHGRPGIEAICWYISDWRNPPPEQADDGEAWVGTPLPALYKQ